MDNITFRKAEEAAESQAIPEPKPVTSENTGTTVTEVPELVATYMEDQGKPYVAKYLEIEGLANKPEYKRDLGEIEGFIKDRVAKNKLDNSTKAANQYLKEIERKAGLTRYESANARISKILAYIDFMKVVES